MIVLRGTTFFTHKSRDSEARNMSSLFRRRGQKNNGWYFKKAGFIWQPFLKPLRQDAPEWKKYSETFLEKMAWMRDVTTEHCIVKTPNYLVPVRVAPAAANSGFR